MSRTTRVLDPTAPLAIEPFDKEWGVGVSGLTEDPSPFPRVNRMLKWVKERDSTADSQRALIVTQGYEKYAMYPQNVKWGLIMRDILSQVDIHIWPEELIVGELAAQPCSAAAAAQNGSRQSGGNAARIPCGVGVAAHIGHAGQPDFGLDGSAPQRAPKAGRGRGIKGAAPGANVNTHLPASF